MEPEHELEDTLESDGEDDIQEDTINRDNKTDLALTWILKIRVDLQLCTVASNSDWKETVQLMINEEFGIDIKAQDNLGKTPLADTI